MGGISQTAQDTILRGVARTFRVRQAYTIGGFSRRSLIGCLETKQLPHPVSAHLRAVVRSTGKSSGIGLASALPADMLLTLVHIYKSSIIGLATSVHANTQLIAN